LAVLTPSFSRAIEGRVVEVPARRRVGIVASLLCLLVSGAGVVAVARGADAADRPAARLSSQWLARQLAADGTLQSPLGGALPDHGLMIDVLFALYASGDRDLAEPIVDYFDGGRHASDYFTWDGLAPGLGYDAIITGGAAAKVLVAAEVSGRDPRSFGGYDMVAETQGTIMRSGPDRGRVSDYSKNPDFADFVSNNANMFGQALAVIGLAGVGENDQLAIDTLLTQQCSEGYFRILFGLMPTDETGDQVTPTGYKVSTCDEGKAYDQSAPDGDATGIALSALLAARQAGATGLDEPIGRAVSWLKQRQDPAGGWGGGVTTEAPNTNSTGLIMQALADAGGANTAVDRGVAYIKSAQVATAAAGTPLAAAVGAIAYTPADYEAASTAGIVGVDSWIRASAQASLGLSQVGFYDLTRGALPTDPTPSAAVTTATPRPFPTRTVTRTASPPAGRSPVAVQAGDTSMPAGPDPGRTTRPPPRPPRSTGSTVVPASGRTPQVGTASPPGRLAAYLAAQLVGGDHVEITENGKTFVDYDATADLVLALRTLGEQPAAALRVTRFLLQPTAIQAYAHGVPYEKGPAAYAEPLAKLAIIARFGQAEASPPADLRQTISTLDADLAGLRGTDGRFTDMGSLADPAQTVRRHVWATLATIAAGSLGSATALTVLTRSQCTDGTFPVTLGSGGCASGDLAVTAAAVLALNAQPAAGPSRSSSVAAAAPPDWPAARSDAVGRAAAALASRENGGLVGGHGGGADVALSAAVAAGRQAAGLDATDTARALAGMLQPDGGMAKAGGTASDPLTSIAVAPGVAGRAWTAASGSPVTTAVRLPLSSLDPGTGSPAADAGTPLWLVVILVAAGLLIGLVLWLRRYAMPRFTSGKAVAS
jgi:hypothetical protein